jgi:hypothetical protein
MTSLKLDKNDLYVLRGIQRAEDNETPLHTRSKYILGWYGVYEFLRDNDLVFTTTDGYIYITHAGLVAIAEAK